jgi:hypothetical protein
MSLSFLRRNLHRPDRDGGEKVQGKSGLRNQAIFAFLALLTHGAQAQAQTHNALTAGEKAAGYSLLFNGSDLAGWRSYDSLTPPSSWVVVPESIGTAILLQNQNPRSPLVSSDMSFRNFDLMLEWNVADNGESGIHIRYNNHNVNEWGGSSGPEAQIAASNSVNGQGPLYRAGACYDMFPLLDKAKNWDGTPNFGKWQQFRILAYEGHVAHFGNGIKLLEYDMHSAVWDSTFHLSHYASYYDYKTIHPGSIYLEHHGSTGIRFRDIRIKKLTENPWAQGSAYLASPTDTSSLQDLAFTDPFANGIVKAIAPAVSPSGIALFPAPDGLRIRFAQPGTYLVRTQDGQGRTTLSRSFENAREAWLPMESIGKAAFLSVWSGRTRIHAGVVLSP